jgi:hypothetical protein
MAARGLLKGAKNSLDGIVLGVLGFGMVPAGIYWFCSPGKTDAVVMDELEKKYGVKETHRSMGAGAHAVGQGAGVGSDDAGARRANFASVIQQSWADKKDIDAATEARNDQLLRGGLKAKAPRVG